MERVSYTGSLGAGRLLGGAQEHEPAAAGGGGEGRGEGRRAEPALLLLDQLGGASAVWSGAVPTLGALEGGVWGLRASARVSAVAVYFEPAPHRGDQY